MQIYPRTIKNQVRGHIKRILLAVLSSANFTIIRQAKHEFESWLWKGSGLDLIY